MKKNVTILIGVVVLVAVIYGGSVIIKKSGRHLSQVKDLQSSIAMKSFAGQVTRVYEGDNILDYAFSIPETSTTSIDMDGALIKVIDGDAPLSTIYMSYEGGRGYSPLDYLSYVVAPHVSVINAVGTSTIGNYDWYVAESEGSEWHIASVASSSWLVVVENKKSAHDTVRKLIEAFSVK